MAEQDPEVEETRKDWERKRADDSVPGAAPPERGDDRDGDAADGPAEDWRNNFDKSSGVMDTS